MAPSKARAQSPPQNPITIENQNPGTTDWQIPWGSEGQDATGQIKGYAGAPSVNKGQNITFYISVNPAQNFTIDVYRMGWYQGLGGRLMQHIGPIAGPRQPTCPTDPTTGMIECHWSAVYTLATQTTWTSGIYLAYMTNSAGYHNYIVFCVRDDSRVAPLLYSQAVTTYQAYNNYPYDQRTGKSLYGFNSYGANTISGGPQAVKVSFDRPYEFDGTGNVYSQSFLTWELPFIRWMEMMGYDVTYATNLETHLSGASLLTKYNAFLSVGHDEYWSKPMFDAMVAARDAGVNLGFFGSNPGGWQIRFEASSSNVPNRVIVCYRDQNLDPNPDPTLKTVQWRDPPLNRPEQTLTGVMFTAMVPWTPNGWANYVVTNASHWVYAGTGFHNGDSVPYIVGYEADQYFPNYPGPTNTAPGTFTLLSSSPLGVNGLSGNSSVYQAQSGAWVFAAGTNSWSWALDNYNGTNVVDARIQQTTANVLNRFINPTVNFSIAASPASQTVTAGGGTSYGVTVTPTGGFAGQVTLSVSGLPSGANGSFSPNPTTTSSTLSVTTTGSTAPGTYQLTITGVSGNLSHTATVTLVVNAPPDFSLGVSPSSRTIGQGGSTSYGVTITPTGSFGGQVTLSVSGLPSGANGSFSPNPATTSSTLTVTTSASTPTGTYTLTITGISGALQHSVAATLVVSTPDFSLAVSPTSRTVTMGSATSYGVTITPVLGFGGQVTMSVSGLPAGANGSYSPNPATTSSTLTVTTTTSTPAGTYTLTITGVSGALNHSTTVSLTVARPGVVFDNAVSTDYQYGVTSITTPAFVVGSGANRAAMIMVSMSANNAFNITASLGGVAATLVPNTDTGTNASLRTMIFSVINPPSGSQTATVSWTTSMSVDVAVITVSGADQTTPVINGTYSATNSSPTGTASVTVTSSAGDLTASVATCSNSFVSPYTNQTLRWGIDSGQVGGDTGPGTGTTTHTWTSQFISDIEVASGANFKAHP